MRQHRRSLGALFVLTILLASWPAHSGGADDPATEAKDVLQRIGGKRGYCVVLGDPDGRLAVELARASELTVYLQSSKAAEVDAARRTAESAGLLGSRVYVEKGNPACIHLADNLADAVIVGESARGAGGTPEAELLRVLRPEGKALLGKTEVVKPFPKGIDEWRHPYHGPDNNPQSKDEVARGPYLPHFLSEPWYCPMPQVTVVSGGRIFKAFGNRSFVQPQWPWLNTLIGLNAYNGTLLWKRDLNPGFMIHRSTMIATPTTLYLADDTSCKLLDAATGQVKDEIKAPADLSDGPVWKWMALEGGVLYALVGEKEPAETTQKIGGFRGAGWPWWKYPDYSFGFGRTILALDPATKKVLWLHREKELLDTRAMCMANGRLYCYSNQKFLRCLDAKTGKVIWNTSDAELLKAIGEHKPAQNAPEGFASTSFIKCSDKALFFAGPTRSNLLAASAADGKLLWQMPDGNFQLVLRDNLLYAFGRGKSLKIEPLSGKTLEQIQGRVACTRATGSAEAIFTRGGKGGSTSVFDVTSRESTTLRTLSPMRPACQDGVLPVQGHFYWGPWMCRCDLTQVGVMCLEPAGSFNYEAEAKGAERLEAVSQEVNKAALVAVTADDWPTYRKDNARSTRSESTVTAKAAQLWASHYAGKWTPTAPVTAGGLVVVGGSDGVVRALEPASGKPLWSAYTGGPIKYSPSIWNGRVYAGSGDGYVYCFEAATGKTLWRFRAAPDERKIPVFGALSSPWPVGSGVLVEDGVAYAAAGIFNFSGTHVYALDALTGKLRWQNNSSGNPKPEEGPQGAGVQGHLLLHQKALCLAGGTATPIARYDIADGRFSADPPPKTRINPPGSIGGGKDLFIADGQVKVSGFPLYWRPEDSHFISVLELASSAGNLIVTTAQPTNADTQVGLLEGKSDPAGKHKTVWSARPFGENAAVAVAKNAVVVAGVDRSEDGSKTTAAICALSLKDGKELWRHPLPAGAVSFGLAIGRDGRVLVSLQDGRVVCFGAGK